MAVVGVDVAEALFPGMDPLNHEIRIKGRPFLIIGVLQRRGSFLGMVSMDNLVIMPLRAFQQLYGKNRSLDINIQARDAALVDKAQDEVTNLLRRRRERGAAGRRTTSRSYTNESMTESFNQLSQVITHRGLRRVPAVAGGGRHRHPEHHAGVGDGADAGDRHPQGAGGAQARASSASSPPRR